jgi:hypothetical protein
MVDFAKHGKCIKKVDYQELSKLIKQWPDFIQGKEGTFTTLPTVESKNILGRLYRQVDTTKFYEKCLSVEHTSSILCRYPLNEFVMGSGFSEH